MKNEFVFTLTALTLLTSIGFSDGISSYNAHQIYFGPELLEVSVKTDIDHVGSWEELGLCRRNA